MDGESHSRCRIALLIANDASTRDLPSAEKEKLIDGYCSFFGKPQQRPRKAKDVDLLSSDWNLDNEFVFKYNAKVPMKNNLSFSSINTFGGFSDRKRYLDPKLCAKWIHPSGFSVDKLEINAKGNVSTEASLEGLARGLTLYFESRTDDKKEGEFSFAYEMPVGKAKTRFEFVAPYSSAKFTASGDIMGVATTYSADFNLKESNPPIHRVSGSYNGINNVFLSLWLNSKKDFRAFSTYKFCNKFTIGAEAKRVNNETTQAVCGVYSPCAPFNMKLKFGRSNEGKFNVASSVTKCFDKNFKVTGYFQPVTDASVSNCCNLSGFNITNAKWGVNCQLG